MGYGGWGMDGSGIGVITWFIVMMDLILVGVWLWQQVMKR